jgi:hypothetical protein
MTAFTHQQQVNAAAEHFERVYAEELAESSANPETFYEWFRMNLGNSKWPDLEDDDYQDVEDQIDFNPA